ncbi:flagellar hook capping FlgD N-terminal domain-containing protein [Sedimentitalea sp. JM2-8]|uniref:Basal-body rod modification protein FlgD n=1 Tax=Sedimentitalea xiamensis TaxID=3050037 RepID=A0ABT7F9G9_9RHOB|nr:flagellar hook capping FlgD N-terminal domain-containing protein [Sedimentitalea xiamensis]MDK3071615.1 flagellar hook capping FlgD N-terminal domain-containing protein [Sedimentitalea xiamensis]
MIDTNSSLAAATATSAKSPTLTSSKPEGLASDFETFLKMLTAQARYQDPLEPIDSTEYAAQLAQFSMVEQQVQTNDTLTALFSQMGISNMASLAGWVGMEVRADTPVYFDGAPITITPNPDAAAEQAYLVVTDASGQEVQRKAIPVSSDRIQWAGVDSTGAPFEKGVYTFTVESMVGDDIIASGPTEVYGRITEAQIKDGSVVLVLAGGQTLPATSVSALRQPE